MMMMIILGSDSRWCQASRGGRRWRRGGIRWSGP